MKLAISLVKFHFSLIFIEWKLMFASFCSEYAPNGCTWMLLEAIGAAKGVYGSLLGGPWGMRLSEKGQVGQSYPKLRLIQLRCSYRKWI